MTAIKADFDIIPDSSKAQMSVFWGRVVKAHIRVGIFIYVASVARNDGKGSGRFDDDVIPVPGVRATAVAFGGVVGVVPELQA